MLEDSEIKEMLKLCICSTCEKSMIVRKLDDGGGLANERFEIWCRLGGKKVYRSKKKYRKIVDCSEFSPRTDSELQ